VDLIENRVLRIACAEKIGMKRMTAALLYGALRGGKRLAKYLTTIDALPTILRPDALEKIATFGLDIQQCDQISEYGTVFLRQLSFLKRKLCIGHKSSRSHEQLQMRKIEDQFARF
jgi:hypothetical protein